MKRWFNHSSKGSYELAADQQSKSAKDKTPSSPTNDVTDMTVSPLPAKRSDMNSSHASNRNGHTVEAAASPVQVKETAVGSPKKSHRRQKSSGNWQMLLADTPRPDGEPKKEGEDVPDASLSEPIRKPVSSKEARPLSFFRQIAMEEGDPVAQAGVKTKKMEIFPWPESLGTPSPVSTPEIFDTAAGMELMSESVSPMDVDQKPDSGVDNDESCADSAAADTSIHPESHPSSADKLSIHKVDTEEKFLQLDVNDASAIPIDSPFTSMNIEDIEEAVSDSAGKAQSEDLIGSASLPVGEKATATSLPTAGSLSGSSACSGADSDRLDERCVGTSEPVETEGFSRSINHSEQGLVLRTSDPSSVKRKRKLLSSGKRNSYPMSFDSSTQVQARMEDPEVRCEILKISDIDGDDAEAEQKTFVVIDPSLGVEGHSHRLCIRSFSEMMDDYENSDSESERYRLAVAAGETVIDTSDESTGSSERQAAAQTWTTSEHNPPSASISHDDGEIESREKGTLRWQGYKSSAELLSISSMRSFDDASLCSERESMLSIRSGFSNKSYSVNDLTSVERPPGFCTLDMKKMLGSFRMLDNIISEHSAVTRK